MLTTHPGSRRRQRLSRAALAAALLAFSLPTPAGAATYTTTVSPNPFFYPATARLVYRLHVTTGAAPERLWVSVGGNQSRPGGGPGFPGEGKFMKLEPMTLEGPGTVLDRRELALVSDRFCTPAFPDTRGRESFTTPTLMAEIPANSTAAIVLPARPFENAPWRSMDLSVEFLVGPTAGSAHVVRSPSPINVGRHGVPISFRADPAGAGPLWGACLSLAGGAALPLPSVPLGTEVSLGGKTDPAVAGQAMTIRAARRGERAPVDLARVRIQGDGSFRYRWRPTALGDYALGALYRSQSPALADDFSAATSMRIAPPRVRFRPRAVTAVRRVRCRGRRCTIAAHGSVRRPRAAAGVECTGKVRIRVAVPRRLVLSTRVGVRKSCRYRARRRFTLSAARTRFVTVRVSYLGNGVFRPRRGRAVRVKIVR